MVDDAGGCRDLDAVLDAARAAERAGEQYVVVPGSPADGSRSWPGTAQALAVLLATTRVRVVLPVDAGTSEPDALLRFARSAAGLSGDRLTLQVTGRGADTLVSALAGRWDGEVLVGDGSVSTEQQPVIARAS